MKLKRVIGVGNDITGADVAEADGCSDDTAAPTVDRPQLGRSLEIAAYLARNCKFESIPFRRRVGSELGATEQFGVVLPPAERL